ncbi:MAG: hypothetical protein CACLOHII_00104 [Candidatus Westeberhardia cardiocondylae]|nr:hypothetical protein [Candidatus Westeberhardia cardiocondylae]
MILSMMSFYKENINKPWGKASWEILSTNKQFLEIKIHLPKQFHFLKQIIKNKILSKLSRGEIECNLYIKEYFNTEKKTKLILNKKLITKLIKYITWIKKKNKSGTIDILSILKWPGVITQIQEDNLNNINIELLNSFENTLNNFIKNRKKEGNTLKNKIKTYLYNLEQEIQKIRKKLPALLIEKRKNILKKIKKEKVYINNYKLEKEIILFLQKIDITEELDIFEKHINTIYYTISKDKPVGRKLYFIIQECNRELDKIMSKIMNTNITTMSIKIKILIEQILKQIQNIE